MPDQPPDDTDDSARQYPTRPLVGIGVVVWRDGKVLLIRRGKAPRKGQWSLPGGAQKTGETVREAARREVLEETGLDVEIGELVDVVDSLERDADGRVRTHYTLVDFSARAGDGDAVAGGDAAEVAWMDPADLPGLGLWSETERIIRLSQARLDRES